MKTCSAGLPTYAHHLHPLTLLLSQHTGPTDLRRWPHRPRRLRLGQRQLNVFRYFFPTLLFVQDPPILHTPTHLLVNALERHDNIVGARTWYGMV